MAKPRAKSPAAPKNLRIGLKWRDGQPRWEPSPASRKVGIKGLDLKGADGAWLERGAAITAADNRQIWAQLVRDAHGSDASADQARADLRLALDNLPPLREVNDRHARSQVQDLIDKARQLLDGLEPALTARGGRHGVTAMVEGYFDDERLEISAGTREAYGVQSKKILARFADRRVDELTTGQIRDWYLDLKDAYSLATSNQAVSALGAMLQWAVYKDWIKTSPAVKLGLQTPQGRRVFWTVEEEQTYIPWLDANGYADLADALVFMLWAGPRSSDACAADLPDLAGDSWRYVPIKTRKSGREALPGIVPAVRARIDRRLTQTITTTSRAFLYDPRPSRQRRHTPDSLAELHREARALAVAAGAVPATILHKQIRDTRDTCITKLLEVEPSLIKISAWTGHSLKDIEQVLRDAYFVLREEGARETAAKLIVWAEQNGMALG